MKSDLLAIGLELGISRETLAARQLSECLEASLLEVAELGYDGKEHLLVPAAAIAWRNLKAAAQENGVSLCIVSAFRSISRQTEIIRRKLEAGASIEEILMVCAPPGYSEHHTGRAIDISTPQGPVLEKEFELTPAFAWLETYAAEFGFYLTYPVGNRFGYHYEPWHWCYIESSIDTQSDTISQSC